MTGSGTAAPLWICFLPQLVSVVGDSFGQRCSRVYHHHSRRRFLIALVFVTATQMFVVLTFFQLAFPSVTTPITEKKNGTTVDFCDTEEGKDSEYCYSQGPLTIYKALDLCPMLLLDGVVNIVYYIGEATMYKQSLGVLLLVLTALTSSFLVAPMQSLFGLKHGPAPGALPTFLGIVGALLCLIERQVVDADEVASEPSDAEREGSDAEGDDGAPPVDVASQASLQTIQTASGERVVERSPLMSSENAGLVGDNGSISQLPPPAANPAGKEGSTLSSRSKRSGTSSSASPAFTSLSTKEKAMYLVQLVFHHLPLIIPFTLLALVYAMYFVLMDYYNANCKMNLWGYNAADQVLLPLYVYGAFAIIDAIGPFKRTFEAANDQHESFLDACKGAARELMSHKGMGFVNMFVYRFLINARALAYTYIATSYNLAASYLELTLIRVVISWIASFLLVLFIPRFIHTAKEEQAQMKDWVNVVLKVVGTGFIIGSLLIMHD